MKIADKTVLTTGGAGGVGSALVEKFAAGDSRLIICGRGGDALAKIAARTPQVIPMICDLSRDNAIRSLTAVTERDYPSLSMLVNNAAVQFN